MLLSRSGEYTIRALIFIADHRPAEPVTAVEIADTLHVPRNYLSKLLHQLARAGLLRSGRGPRGGFSLNRPAETLSLATVLAAIDSDHIDRTCLLGRDPCDEDRPCPVHHDWKPLREHLDRFLERTTIASLAGSTGKGEPR